MQPTEARLKTLTPVQRQLIADLQVKGIVKVAEPKAMAVYRRLVTLGAAIWEPLSKNEFRIAEGWEAVDVSFQRREPRGPYTAEDFLPFVPDPPKKILVRPPAVYSNRSQNDIIDHVLKNY